MNRFSDAQLDEVRASVPITELIGNYVAWDKQKSVPGRRDMWACCPFHGESTPSFHAEDAKGTYHCFGCGVNGDHFRFLQEQAGMDFMTAVETVAELGGVKLPPRTGAKPSEKSTQPVQDGSDPGWQPDAAPAEPAASGEGKKVIAKTYDYTSGDGDLLYQLCRLVKQLPDGSHARTKDGKGTWKTFLHRRPSGIGDGSWLWGMREGEYMRPAPGKDWRGFDPEAFAEWKQGERRTFGPGPEHTIFRRQAVELAIEAGQLVILAEGEKDAETLADWSLCGTTNSGGSKHWTPQMAALLRGADVVIVVDNDQAGREGGDKKAKSLRGIAKRVRLLDFAAVIPGFPEKNDVSDYAARGGTAEQLLQWIEALPDWRPSPPESKFNAGHIADVAVRRKQRRHSWLVQDLIELGGTTSFSGFSEAGKTFIIIELAFCIAQGQQFFGHDVEQGLVVYQVGEGELGFEKRIEGYCLDRGIADRRAVPFIYLPKKINLFVDDTDTNTLIAECKEWKAFFDMPLRMLVIDTFNKATRGANEISGQDMGKVNDRVERIASELECTVVLIDHLSAQGNLRGHGSKTADVTNTVKVERTDKIDGNGRKIRKVVFGKNKDGEGGVTTAFVLRQVIVEYDELQRPVTTCVVDKPDGNEDEIVASGRLGLDPSILLRVIKDTAEIQGEKAPPELVQVPPGRNVAKWTDVMARLRKTFNYTAPETEPAKRKAELERCVRTGKRLQLAGFIDRDNDRGLIWWTGKEDRARPEPKADKPQQQIPPEVRKEIAHMGVPF